MKFPAIIAIILCLLCKKTAAQISFTNLSSADSSSAVLETGRDNIVRVSNLPRKAHVKISKGELSGQGQNEYIIYRLENAAFTDLFVVGADGSIITQKRYTIKITSPDGSINHPIAADVRLGSLGNTGVSIAQFCVNTNLIVDNGRYTVLDFGYSILRKNDLLGPYQALGANIQSDKWCKTLQPGDRIFIGPIRVTCDTCSEPIYVPNLMIKIN